MGILGNLFDDVKVEDIHFHIEIRLYDFSEWIDICKASDLTVARAVLKESSLGKIPAKCKRIVYKGKEYK
jgi:hypothetical protein